MANTTHMLDQSVDVDGSKIRYLEEGSGVPAILLHGGSLGSSADVFRRNLPALAAGGVRAIALDLPGYGGSDPAADSGRAATAKVILAFADALGLERFALIAHSVTGNVAFNLALENPARIWHLVVLGTAGFLPPLETRDGGQVGGREEAAQGRLEERMVQHEPTIEDTRALLKANLFNHDLITDEELQLRHQNSIGRCFENFVARREGSSGSGGGSRPASPWQRIDELKVPLLMIYGREDRGRAADRVKLMTEVRPDLNVHLAEGCRHLVNWDAADLFHQLAAPFLVSHAPAQPSPAAARD